MAIEWKESMTIKAGDTSVGYVRCDIEAKRAIAEQLDRLNKNIACMRITVRRGDGSKVTGLVVMDAVTLPDAASPDGEGD